jgi:hypothetical protein
MIVAVKYQQGYLDSKVSVGADMLANLLVYIYSREISPQKGTEIHSTSPHRKQALPNFFTGSPNHWQVASSFCDIKLCKPKLGGPTLVQMDFKPALIS